MGDERDDSRIGAAGAVTHNFVTAIRTRAERRSNLVAYRDRLMVQYFPDFARQTAAPA
jgi:hypothetical protein